jgi:CHRD domain-containing protein
MKTQFKFPSRIISIFVIAVTMVAFVSCSKDNNDKNNTSGMYNVSGNANGTQVVPSVTGTGSGTLTGTYNANTNLLTYNMAWTGLTGSPTSTAFYSGASGANGALVGNTRVTTNGATGASVGTITLTDAQETALLSGGMYYLVGTSAHTSGEIRGQVTATLQ